MHYLGQLPDLPLPHLEASRLRTRRKPLAQIVLCQGCCCGHTERGLPAVPLDWLKPLWKSEKLNKIVQLTVSGCLGPCDLPNVCCIATPQEQAWYGRLTTQEDYAMLLNWARRCREQSDIVPLTAADTDILTWSAAVAGLPNGFPSVRALNLDRLRHRRGFHAYLDDV